MLSIRYWPKSMNVVCLLATGWWNSLSINLPFQRCKQFPIFPVDSAYSHPHLTLPGIKRFYRIKFIYLISNFHLSSDAQHVNPAMNKGLSNITSRHWSRVLGYRFRIDSLYLNENEIWNFMKMENLIRYIR